jgi:hypothetical protein
MWSDVPPVMFSLSFGIILFSWASFCVVFFNTGPSLINGFVNICASSLLDVK